MRGQRTVTANDGEIIIGIGGSQRRRKSGRVRTIDIRMLRIDLQAFITRAAEQDQRTGVIDLRKQR